MSCRHYRRQPCAVMGLDLIALMMNNWVGVESRYELKRMRPFSKLSRLPYASPIPTRLRHSFQDMAAPKYEDLSKVPCAAGNAFCLRITFCCVCLSQAQSSFFLDASGHNIWTWFQALSFYSQIVDNSYLVLLKNQFLFLSEGSFLNYAPAFTFSLLFLLSLRSRPKTLHARSVHQQYSNKLSEEWTIDRSITPAGKSFL